MQGKPKSSMAWAMRSRVSSGGSQSSGIHQESSLDLHLGLEAALLHQVEERGQKAEAQGGVGGQQGGDVGDEPACPDALRWEGVALQAERGNEDQEKCDREGEDAEGDGVVEPPGQEEQAGDGKPKQRFNFAGADGHPAMGLNEHFYDRNEMEEEGHAAQVHAPPARTL